MQKKIKKSSSKAKFSFKFSLYGFLGIFLFLMSLAIIVIYSQKQTSVDSQASVSSYNPTINASLKVKISKKLKGCDAGTTGYKVVFELYKNNKFYAQKVKAFSPKFNSDVSIGDQFIDTNYNQKLGASYGVKYTVIQSTRGRGDLVLKSVMPQLSVPLNMKGVGNSSFQIAVACQ